jgi:tripartite-type tricarboxylate transporter receptor subunit TctC
MKARVLRVLSLALVAASCVLSPAQAAFPEKALRIIVPFPPGGSTDVVARRVAARAQRILGQAIVIENAGGAGGIVGTDLAAKAAPDGYTLLLAQTSLASNVALREKLPYDTERDFTPIALLADHPGLLVSSVATPYRTFADMMKYARANPGKVNYASAGVGTFPHLTMAMLESQARVSLMHIPYKGAGPAMVDLLGGRVDIKVDAYVTALPALKGGKLVALAVTGKGRIPQMPDLPAVAESYPDFESEIWMGIVGPAGMPREIAARLEAAFVEASRDPEVVRTLNEEGIYARGLSAKELTALIARDIARWRRVVKEAGIKPE